MEFEADAVQTRSDFSKPLLHTGFREILSILQFAHGRMEVSFQVFAVRHAKMTAGEVLQVALVDAGFLAGMPAFVEVPVELLGCRPLE